MPDPDPNAGNLTDWRGGLPEDLRAEKSLEVIKGKDWSEAGPTLAKSYVEAQKMIGGSVRIPKEDAKPEEIAAFYGKLGRPEAPEKYDFQRPMLPQGAWSEDAEKEFRKLAHDHGLTNKQVQALVKYHGDTILGAMQQTARQTEANVAEIKRKYGADFGNRAAMAEKAVFYLSEEAGVPFERVKEFLESTGLGNHPVLFELFGKLGESYLEHGFIRAEGIPGSAKEAALAKIKAIQADPKHPFWNDGPGHKEAMEEWESLHKQAYK